LISRSPELRLEEAINGFPVLRSRLADVAVSSGERGAVTATMRLRRVTRGNFALIGDAGNDAADGSLQLAAWKSAAGDGFKAADFSALLAMHVGALSLRGFVATSAELGWRLICG
jgi:hypothetical protein